MTVSKQFERAMKFMLIATATLTGFFFLGVVVLSSVANAEPFRIEKVQPDRAFFGSGRALPPANADEEMKILMLKNHIHVFKREMARMKENEEWYLRNTTEYMASMVEAFQEIEEERQENRKEYDHAMRRVDKEDMVKGLELLRDYHLIEKNRMDKLQFMMASAEDRYKTLEKYRLKTMSEYKAKVMEDFSQKDREIKDQYGK